MTNPGSNVAWDTRPQLRLATLISDLGRRCQTGLNGSRAVEGGRNGCPTHHFLANVCIFLLKFIAMGQQLSCHFSDLTLKDDHPFQNPPTPCGHASLISSLICPWPSFVACNSPIEAMLSPFMLVVSVEKKSGNPKSYSDVGVESQLACILIDCSPMCHYTCDTGTIYS